MYLRYNQISFGLFRNGFIYLIAHTRANVSPQVSPFLFDALKRFASRPPHFPNFSRIRQVQSAAEPHFLPSSLSPRSSSLLRRDRKPSHARVDGACIYVYVQCSDCESTITLLHTSVWITRDVYVCSRSAKRCPRQPLYLLISQVSR